MGEGTKQPFDRLEVLDDQPPRSAALNMALDETLLANLGANPLLRIYRWAHPAVSFGYFTPWQSVANRYPDRELVRRWTGGGVVEHGDDVTFSLLVPRWHPLSNGPAGQSYRLIHAALRFALLRVGCDGATLADDPGEPSGVASAPCFANPVRYDVLVDGQKISGGAQRRTRHGLLHQGSVRWLGAARFNARDLATALPAAFGLELPPRFIADEETNQARNLAATKYSSVAWTQRV